MILHINIQTGEVLHNEHCKEFIVDNMIPILHKQFLMKRYMQTPIKQQLSIIPFKLQSVLFIYFLHSYMK